MSEQAGEQQGGTSGTGEAQTGGTGQGATSQPQVRESGTQVQATQAEAQQGGTGTTAGGVESLPDWAQAEMRKLRAEAASSRVNAKETAAEEARTKLLAELSKALGVGGDTPPDPEKLKADLEKTTAERRSTLVELAVVRSASRLGADAEALLDSRGFLSKLGKLDPAADDFATLVADEIAAAVKDNPRLSLGTPATRSGGEITGGAADKGGSGESWDDIEKLVKAQRGR